MPEIGELLTAKEIRTNKRISQEKVAKAIGCSSRQFRRYENIECPVPLHHALVWAKELGLTIGQLVKALQVEK